jgi:hypothetical protein
MISEQELLQKFLDILCNDFEVGIRPKLIYAPIPLERFTKTGGVYSAKDVAILVNVFDFDAVLHEFTHHLQFEQSGWDFEKYISQFIGGRLADQLAITYELEAFTMEVVLGEIYADVINRMIFGFKKIEPLGRRELCQKMVKYILEELLRVDEEVYRIEYILNTETDPLSKNVLGIFLELFGRIDLVYDWIKRTLKYTIRVCTKQWEIPEFPKFTYYITTIRYKTDDCSDTLEKAINDYIPIPSRDSLKKKLDEIKYLHTEFRDLLFRVFPIGL